MDDNWKSIGTSLAPVYTFMPPVTRGVLTLTVALDGSGAGLASDFVIHYLADDDQAGPKIPYLGPDQIQPNGNGVGFASYNVRHTYNWPPAAPGSSGSIQFVTNGAGMFVLSLKSAGPGDAIVYCRVSRQ